MSARSRQRAAFAVYLDLGSSRSLAKVHAALKLDPARHGLTKCPSLRSLEAWSTRFGWRAEVEEIERAAQREEEHEHIEHVKEHRARLRQEGLLLQQKGVSWLSAKAADEVRAHEAVRAIVEGFRLEALGLGEVTARIAVEEEYGNVIGRLNDEELERAIALLQSAAPGSAPGAGGAEPG
jgi:hypothetical protein